MEASASTEIYDACQGNLLKSQQGKFFIFIYLSYDPSHYEAINEMLAEDSKAITPQKAINFMSIVFSKIDPAFVQGIIR